MSGSDEDFAAFWAAYPRRTAKLAALKAWGKARKIATAQEILDGVERYRRTMPAEIEFRPHPATWLNAGRWMDEDEPEPAVREFWADECQREHGGACLKRWDHEMRKRGAA